MLLKKDVNPKTITAIGLVVLAVALVGQYFIRPTTAIGPDVTDFLRGGMMGVAIGMNLVAIAVNVRANRAR